jgi:hypothetical protein
LLCQKDLYNDAQDESLPVFPEEITTQYNTNYQKALKVANQKVGRGYLGDGRFFLS